MRYPDLTKKLQDLTHLTWSDSPHASGTSGSFPKATYGSGTNTIYYKASSYDSTFGFIGHECVNELIASRLMNKLGVAHVPYSLIHARIVINGTEHETWINASKSYRRSSERKQAFSKFYAQYRNDDEDPLALCDRMGWGTTARQMLLVDYLIINQDRHGGNVEVLQLKDGRKRLAPIFDCGNSLMFSCYDVESEIRNFDPMVDAYGANFIGGKRLEDNLRLIPAGIVNPLMPEDKDWIFRGLDVVLPQYHLDKIWEIIWNRWCRYAHV